MNILFHLCACALLSSALPFAPAVAGDTDGFTFATWNIGHFSLGLRGRSTIPPARAKESVAAYRAFVEKSGATVIGLCEYSDYVVSNDMCRVGETFLSDFSGSSKGASFASGHCNALYWKGADLVRDGHVDYPARRYDAYYQFARLRIAGREVCVVETHLDWNTMDPGHEQDRVKQIRKLIDDFKDEPYVVIGGDFNTCVLDKGRGWIDAPEEFKPFADAGFALANCGRHLTWPAKKPVQSIDNIIAKGFAISDVGVQADPALSDHALLKCRLTFLSTKPTKSVR